MINIYYLVMFIVSVILTFVYVIRWHKHFDLNISLLFLLVPIENLGYILLARSTVIEEAVIANKIIYLGASFISLFLLFSIIELCHFELKRIIRIVFLGINIIIYLAVLTINKYPIFYKSFDFVIQNGVGSIINKKYGFMHTIYYIMIIAYFFLGILSLVIAYVKKKDVSRKMIILMLSSELVCILSFFLGRLFIKSFDLVPIVFTFAQILFLIIINKICLYDITDTAIDTIIEKGGTGFISFDFKKQYLGSNEQAKLIMPDLSNFQVDKVINDKLGEEIYSWIDKFKSDNIDDKFYYYYDDATYLVTISYLYDGKKRRGYQLLLTDDTNNQEYIKLLDNYNNELIIEVKEKTQYLEELHDKLILGIAQLVDSRDNSTGGHIKRTSYIMRIFVTEVRKYNKYNLDDEFYDDIIKAAPMHDLGKIAVDDVILRKPGKYTKEEFEIMKHHASYGAEILDKILEGTDEKFKTIACNVAHFHHERVDGSGYPNGLTKDQIPIEARIMAICDVYDALVSKRVYKERMSFEEAKKIILEGMGSQFDNELRIYFLNSVDKFEEYYSSLDDF